MSDLSGGGCRWSLGCILAELWTGRVLFQNDSLATLLARVVGILGGIEENLLLQGRYSHRFFTKHKILYDRLSDDDRSLVYIFPKKTSLKHRLATDDTLFVDFVNKLLQVNPAKRFSATEVLPKPLVSLSLSLFSSPLFFPSFLPLFFFPSSPSVLSPPP